MSRVLGCGLGQYLVRAGGLIVQIVTPGTVGTVASNPVLVTLASLVIVLLADLTHFL